jgi:gas vesicle protein
MDKTDMNVGLVALFSFLIGGAVGAGLALLMAPQSGKKTRRQLRNMAEDVAEQATEYTDRLKKKIF